MQDTVRTLLFAEDLSYQIYFTLGRTTPWNQRSKIARRRLTVVSPYHVNIGQAVLHVINAHKAIADCYCELVRDGVSDHEQVRNYLIEAAPLYFDEGYKHECFMAFCASVIGVCGMYLEGGCSDEFVEVGIGVISTVLLGFIINKEFQGCGEWSELIDTCGTFNECEARRLQFLDELNDKHEECKAIFKKKYKNIVHNKLVDTSTPKFYPFTENRPKTSKAVVYQGEPSTSKEVGYEGFTIAECESSAAVTEADSILKADVIIAECESSATVTEADSIVKADVAEEPVASTSKSAAKRRKKRGKWRKKDATEDASQEVQSEQKTPTKLEMESPNKSTEFDRSTKSIDDLKQTLQMFQGIINKAIPMRRSDPDMSEYSKPSSDHLVENKSERSDANEKSNAKRRKRKGKSGKSNNANAAINEDKKSPHKCIETKESSACSRENEQGENLPEDASKTASIMLKEQFESAIGDFVAKLNVSKKIEKEKSNKRAT